MGNRGFLITALNSKIWSLKGGIVGENVCAKLLLSSSHKYHAGARFFGPLKLPQTETMTIWFHQVR